MRIYISVDMEGIAGVVHESQTNPTDPASAADYGRFRRLMTAEANAAVAGALAAGATRVRVNDSHWFMRNLVAEELHQAAELVAGDPKPHSMVQGIDRGFDAALFIGYHARPRTRNAIADLAELCPGATRTGGRTVTFTHGDYREVFRAWRALLNLSAAA